MTTDLRRGWKILTHDGRSPLQGGPPLLNGSLPVVLPTVPLDTGSVDCAAGWNYVAHIAMGWQIVGLWPTGRPSRVLAVEASSDAIERGQKRRASSLTLVREATQKEIQAALKQFSRPFGDHVTRMTHEQAQWWIALSRPFHDVAEVEAQLALALSARESASWTLRKYETARAARAASDAWDAWAALCTYYVRLMSWQVGEPEQYTVGIREAYRHGLEVAVPVAPKILGWAMKEI